MMTTDDLLTVARTTKYPLDAFLFVQRALDYTVQQMHGEMDPRELAESTESGSVAKRHITGKQLCHGLRDYAIQQYGLLSLTILRRWHINSCQDLGHIIFTMVDAKMMSKTDEDSLDDFTDVFDFEAAFSPALSLTETNPSAQKE